MPRNFIDSTEDMEKLLREETVGYLGLAENDRPYVVPITYGYSEKRIIFHGGLEGKKLEIIKINPNVCFTVSRHYGVMVDHPQGAKCHADSDSVICFGKARIIEDVKEKCQLLNIFNTCIQPNAREITDEEVGSCSAVVITIETMTGRTERNSKCTYWKWTKS